MLLRKYTKDEVNNLVQKEVVDIKNELVLYIDKLQQKNRMLEETIKELTNRINEIETDLNKKILTNTKDIEIMEKIKLIIKFGILFLIFIS